MKKKQICLRDQVTKKFSWHCFTHLSKTAALQQLIFVGTLSTIIIFKQCKFYENLWTLCFVLQTVPKSFKFATGIKIINFGFTCTHNKNSLQVLLYRPGVSSLRGQGHFHFAKGNLYCQIFQSMGKLLKGHQGQHQEPLSRIARIYPYLELEPVTVLTWD